MYQQVPELEQRLSELQTQIDRLSLSLHLWRQSQDHLQPMERRLAQLTDQCAEILDRWTATGDRHTQVVNDLEARLSDWNTTEARLQQDASQRIQQLERLIEHEWTELRRIHEEPMRELREQAASLSEVSVAAAQTAQVGFERAEARLAAIESHLHRWMGEVTREVHTAIAGGRPRTEAPAWPPPGPPAAWPLEGVVRLHEQLRQDGAPDPGGAAQGPPSGEAPLDARAQVPPRHEAHVQPEAGVSGEMPQVKGLPPAPPELVERLNALERALTDSQTEAREQASKTERATRTWRWAAVVLALGTGMAVWLAVQSQQQSRLAAARVADAEERARQVREAAGQQVTASREAAAQEVARAQETAVKAQTISNVLAAPDLLRYSLSGQSSAAAASGQLLWSRSRGLVFSGSRLPAPPPNSTYQIWLLTGGDPVSVSTFEPDTAGRATIALDSPPRVPRPVVGATVTIEPSGGSPLPAGEPVLVRTP